MMSCLGRGGEDGTDELLVGQPQRRFRSAAICRSMMLGHVVPGQGLVEHDLVQPVQELRAELTASAGSSDLVLRVLG